jgi:mono/diheme cytochrome c family protein
MRSTPLQYPLVAALWLAVAWPAFPADATAEGLRFFEARIRPLLADNCYACHGPDKQEANLRFDSADTFANDRSLQSGSPVVVAGKPESSLLIRAVRHERDVPAMPPKRKLKDQDVADLARWIKMGAPYPQASKPKAAQTQKHWAFQPAVEPALPAVKDQAWAITPIDRFILAELEAKGLRPSPAAEPRTLLRRLTFDLTGLPPTLEEVEAFVRECATNPRTAYERCVDRLLESPQYGERWGRHWLDVARYADSNGLDENVAFANAWRYRDYVVDAFNADKPFDQFVREQIAGDLLPGGPEKRSERLIATGFLGIGPKVLAEPDEKKMEMDIIDEQVDTLGRAFMGLTLGCARCHDHKFDPVSQADYYGLAGIFMSTRTMENFKKVARWYENPIGTEREIAARTEADKRIERLKQAIADLTAQADKKVKAAAKPDEQLPKKLEPRYTDAQKAELKKLRDELATIEKNAAALPTALGVTELTTVVNAAMLPRGNHLTPGKVVPRGFPTALVNGRETLPGDKQSGRLELAHWLASKDNPLTARVIVNRVWRWHLGQGLVRSVDNFGRLGEAPSHPQLLDWLAVRFVQDGWSIKKLHRLIVLSQTYRQSSARVGQAPQADPDNRLLWRMNPRRLEAEEIRDALLAVAGSLDRTLGGPSMPNVANRSYLFDHTSKDKTNYDSTRRSLYLPVIRNNLYDVLQLFDATDATVGSGDRATTTVATQALFWMNSELVMGLASRLTLPEKNSLTVRQRLRHCFLTAYGREPVEREFERFSRAYEKAERSLRDDVPDAGKRIARAWTLVGQVILSANEFIYVE